MRNYMRSQSGTVFVYTALLLPVFLGFGGLVLDVGSWYKTHQDGQIAADAAAIGGAWEIAHGNTGTVTSAAIADAGKNGFTSGSNNVTVTVNNPPKSGNYTNNANAVEVIVSQQTTSMLSAIILKNTFPISARAVALANTKISGAGTACILALDKAMSGAITMNGNLKANFQNCILAANSTSSSAVSVGGNVSVTASSIYTSGNISQFGGDTLNLSSPATTGAPTIPDPYSSVNIPAYSSNCTQTNYSPGNNATLNPGVYCGGISFQHNTTLNPGTYYLTNGDFKASGQATITCNCKNPGDGVTIVLTGSSPGGVGIQGGAVINLQAPTDAGNPFDGFLFYQDRNAAPGTAITFNGSSTLDMVGTFYFPNGAFTWNGDSTDPSSCTQIVADSVKLTGNTTITDSSCGTQGAGQITPPAQIIGVNIVE